MTDQDLKRDKRSSVCLDQTLLTDSKKLLFFLYFTENASLHTATVWYHPMADQDLKWVKRSLKCLDQRLFLIQKQ
jgi:hypothetical protein